jgi:hypothetical protein
MPGQPVSRPEIRIGYLGFSQPARFHNGIFRDLTSLNKNAAVLEQCLHTLHKVHELNAYKGGHVSLSECFSSEITERI